VHPRRQRHDVHRPGHHGPRGRQPHARVPRLRHGREGGRRRDAGPQGPRGARRPRLRHGRPGRRASRSAHRRLRRHGAARLHQGRGLRGHRERHQADRHRHGAHPAPRRRPDGRARRPARRADHRPELPRDHRPRRHQDGRHRRPGQGRGQGLLPRTGRRDLPFRRHDDGDVEHADRDGPRPVDGGLDRGRRDHRPDLRRADAPLRGRRGHAGHRDLHRTRWSHGGRARALDDREPVAPADRRLHGRQVHGRDAGHVLRPRGHDRRGHPGHGRREDRATGRGRDRRGRGDLRDPRPGQAGRQREDPSM
ncbi:MAG: Succinyl-CoA ligase [ADP-forming] alpha chain, partial [uncultured Solirubrobacteraceae bacterium]